MQEENTSNSSEEGSMMKEVAEDGVLEQDYILHVRTPWDMIKYSI